MTTQSPTAKLKDWQKFEKKYQISKSYASYEQIIYMAFEAGVKSSLSQLQQIQKEVEGLHQMQYGLASENPTPVWVKKDNVISLLNKYIGEGK